VGKGEGGGMSEPFFPLEMYAFFNTMKSHKSRNKDFRTVSRGLRFKHRGRCLGSVFPERPAPPMTSSTAPSPAWPTPSCPDPTHTMNDEKRSVWVRPIDGGSRVPTRLPPWVLTGAHEGCPPNPPRWAMEIGYQAPYLKPLPPAHTAGGVGRRCGGGSVFASPTRCRPRSTLLCEVGGGT